MSHNEEHTRCQLIGACSASAQSALDAAVVELDRADDSEGLALVATARQSLGELERRYPCDRGGRRGGGGE